MKSGYFSVILPIYFVQHTIMQQYLDLFIIFFDSDYLNDLIPLIEDLHQTVISQLDILVMIEILSLFGTCVKAYVLLS